MPGHTILDLPAAEQEQMLAHLRRARYGHLLALHIRLLCAAGWRPSAIAAALFCSRTSVYRTVAAYRRGLLDLGLEAEAAARGASRLEEVAAGLAQARAARLRVVPHTLELRVPRRRVAGASLSLSLARDRPPLAP